MDNRLNEIRRKIIALRAEMLVMEKAVRDLVNRDLDCTDTSLRLMAARADLAVLIRRWREAGGSDRLSVVPEGLRRDARLGGRGKRVKAA
jgi:hypothetical protein